MGQSGFAPLDEDLEPLCIALGHGDILPVHRRYLVPEKCLSLTQLKTQVLLRIVPMLQSAHIDSMEKPLPMKPNQVKGIRAPGVAVLASKPPLNISRAPPITRLSLQRRIKTSFLSFAQSIYQIVGPTQSNKPNGSTVIWSLLGFIAFLGLGCLAVALPRGPMLITLGVFAFLVSSSLAALLAAELRSRSMLALLNSLEAPTDCQQH